MIFDNKDLCYILNKNLEINDILKLRKSFKNNFRIMECHKFIRDITFGKKNYINNLDNYNINLLVYDNYEIFNEEDLDLISNYDKFDVEVVFISSVNQKYFISENYNLLNFLRKLLNDNRINILYININMFYVMCNYLKSYQNDIKLNTLHIKMGSCYDKFLYWDLTLYNLKECLKYFKHCESLIFGNVMVCSTYLSLLRKYNIVKKIEFLDNSCNYYLKKNNIKLKIIINSLNINQQDICYNMYFDCDNDLLLNRNSIRI